ncbi:putative hydrophobic protein (TIGR00341 family) [Sediminihabitans luteus]|uniref:Putative hydrophobic protein (TIGR00341 family) n=1 Tax=Sediminihabitans luteus TaxID=1138585 RepID=A0A2M9D1F9_9CELL|nr:TIGR00341 family protein [Sediminihabitans luteus]PJJ77828.1 putative hydrophobic protein (TIGR00341 family) [Sediminihabitans luteus]GII99814.1 membrane protein [Sediminihabitans luteus]
MSTVVDPTDSAAAADRPPTPAGRRRTFTLVPANQRRSLDELVDRLDLDAGDTRAKRSAFWAMLTLSGIIAISGVITDSTATVIGAMIIAPLSTPILGMGIGIVTGRAGHVGRSALYVLTGVALVVAMGFLAALALPATSDVLTNPQVTGRTSPGVLDLVAAFATGFAGSIALSRKDLGDVLPGIAIAISLVPPLGVVGVCLGSGAPALAAGALLLFLSNVVALVIASTVVFVAASYGRDALGAQETAEGVARRKRAYVAIGAVAVVVAVPMIVNTVSVTLQAVWAGQVKGAAERWLAETPGATVEDVSWQGDEIIVSVRSPEALPDVDDLQTTVDDLVPLDPDVVVLHTVGERVTEQRAGE